MNLARPNVKLDDDRNLKTDQISKYGLINAFLCVCFVLCFFTNSIFKTMELYVIIFMLQNYYYFYVYYSFLLQSSSSSLLPTLLIDERSTALMPTAENSYRKDFFFCFLLRQLSFSNMVKVSALFSSVAFTILTFPGKKPFHNTVRLSLWYFAVAVCVTYSIFL